MTTPTLPKTAAEAVAILALCTFREFTRADWHAYAGCETLEPRIAELGNMTVILDGPECQFIIDVGDTIDSAHFTLS